MKIAETSILSEDAAIKFIKTARDPRVVTNFIRNRTASETVLQAAYYAVSQPRRSRDFKFVRKDFTSEMIDWLIEHLTVQNPLYTTLQIYRLDNITEAQILKLIKFEFANRDKAHWRISSVISIHNDSDLIMSFITKGAKKLKTMPGVRAKGYLIAALNNPHLKIDDLMSFLEQGLIDDDINLLIEILETHNNDDSSQIRLYKHFQEKSDNNTKYKNHKIFDDVLTNLVHYKNPKNSRFLAYCLVSRGKNYRYSYSTIRAMAGQADRALIYELILQFVVNKELDLDSMRLSGNLNEDKFVNICRHYLSILGVDTARLPNSYIVKLASTNFDLSEEIIMRFPTAESLFSEYGIIEAE